MKQLFINNKCESNVPNFLSPSPDIEGILFAKRKPGRVIPWKMLWPKFYRKFYRMKLTTYISESRKRSRYRSKLLDEIRQL